MAEIILSGKYDSAKVFTENIDDVTIGQIINFLNQPFVEGANTRIMPDTHAGKGAVIGTTMIITDKIVPNLVGVDIGCGMLCVEVEKQLVDFALLDTLINKLVPSGQTNRKTAHPYVNKIPLDEVIAPFSKERAILSVGSLGGGNHFIEMNVSEDGRLFLIIHSGSRHLGVKVASYHQKKGIEALAKDLDGLEMVIEQLKAEGRQKEIQQTIQSYKSTKPKIPNELAYVEGKLMDDYLHDLKIAQDLAKWNRAAMMQVIIQAMGFKEVGRIDTIHNYVDLEQMILRKGAISAKSGEEVLIPINMRDGSILAKGKGNTDWNQSAPHGAGRIYSRSKAKEVLKIEDFTETMRGVYSTSVRQETLDESPFAYKPMEEIIENTKDTIDIQAILKPIYNFKATE